MKIKLEAIANVTLILVAMSAGMAMLRSALNNRTAQPSVVVGDRLAPVPGAEWNQHRRTLVLALNTGCHYCQDSVPFYQKLARAQRPKADDLAIVVAFANPAQQVAQFGGHELLAIKSVAPAPFDKWRVAATPTLILVDAQGRVERTWVGLLSSRQEFELLEMVSGTRINTRFNGG